MIKFAENILIGVRKWVNGKLLTKQDVIQDLDAIRSGATLGMTSVQEEIDPTVPSWAKEPTKPTYTVSEISGLTETLLDYYTTGETYTQTEINNLIGAINQFRYEIYANISAITEPQSNVLYLIGPTGTGSDKYEEYVYANSTFTKIGDTTIDLSDYATISALTTGLAGKSNIGHTHQMSEVSALTETISGLQTEISQKQGTLTPGTAIEIDSANTISVVMSAITEIDDTITSSTKTWSSEKISGDLVEIEEAIENIPTKTSDLDNDSGFITGYTETDPTVPAWAKESVKPTYTVSEISGLTEALSEKSNTGHTHQMSEVSALTETISGLQSDIQQKQDILNAGTNISIDTANTINAEGYTFNPSLDSIAEGYSIKEYPFIGNVENSASGIRSHAEGAATSASGIASHSEGFFTSAEGLATHAEGAPSVAIGNGSHAEGGGAVSIGDASHAEGGFDYVLMYVRKIEDSEKEEYSISQNYACIPLNESDSLDMINYLFALFNDDYSLGCLADNRTKVTISGQSLIVFDVNSTEFLDLLLSSKGEGFVEIKCGISPTVAIGYRSHAEGRSTKTRSEASHSEGYKTETNGFASHSEGYYTITRNDSEHAEGKFNVSHEVGYSDGNTQHSIGIGTSSADTKNAFEVMQNGDVYVYNLGNYNGTRLKTDDENVKTLQEVIGNVPNTITVTVRDVVEELSKED